MEQAIQYWDFSWSRSLPEKFLYFLKFLNPALFMRDSNQGHRDRLVGLLTTELYPFGRMFIHVLSLDLFALVFHSIYSSFWNPRFPTPPPEPLQTLFSPGALWQVRPIQYASLICELVLSIRCMLIITSPPPRFSRLPPPHPAVKVTPPSPLFVHCLISL